MSFVLSVVTKTSFLLVCTALVTSMWRRCSASTRHGIWAIGLSAVLVLPLAASVLPGINLPILSVFQTAIQSTQPPLVQGSETFPVSKPQPVIAAPQVRPTGMDWLALAWGIGAIATLFRWVPGVVEMRDLRRNSHTVTDSKWHELLSAVRWHLSVSAPVELRIGGDSIPPMMWGIFRPTILFPSSAAGWTADRLRLVLAHELAHVKRKDRLTQVMIQLACIVYWFNPLVWYAAYRMRIERERACDDQVLNSGEDAGDYADHLLQIAREVTSRRRFATVSMVTQLESRLNAILDTEKDRRTLSTFATAVLVCSIAVLTSLIGTTQLTARPQSSEPKWTGVWVMNFAKSTLVDLDGQSMAGFIQSGSLKLEAVAGGIKETVDFVAGGVRTHAEVTLQDGKAVPPPPSVHSEWIKDAVLKQISDYTFDIMINTNPAAPVPPGTVHVIVAPDGKTLTMTNTVTAAISVFDREQ